MYGTSLRKPSPVHKLGHGRRHVAQRAYLAEILGVDLLAGLLLETHHEVDCIDGIEVEFGEQVHVRRQSCRIAFKIGGEDVFDLLFDFGFGCHVRGPSSVPV